MIAGKTTHAAHAAAGHARGLLLVLRKLRDHRVGRQHQARD
jgi:hypothetical protein